MKKEYIAPQVICIQLQAENSMLTGSNAENSLYIDVYYDDTMSPDEAE